MTLAFYHKINVPSYSAQQPFYFFIIYLFIFCGAELFSFAAILSQNKCTKLFSELVCLVVYSLCLHVDSRRPGSVFKKLDTV